MAIFQIEINISSQTNVELLFYTIQRLTRQESNQNVIAIYMCSDISWRFLVS